MLSEPPESAVPARRRSASGDARAGFTLVEVMVAMVLLAVAFLGMSLSTGRLVRSVAEEEVRAVVQQAISDRLAEIRMDPRYAVLDSIYDGVEPDVLGLEGFERTTTVNRVQEAGAGGRVNDFYQVWVTVRGPFIGSPTTRQTIIAAP